jgi:hypothetical protein
VKQGARNPVKIVFRILIDQLSPNIGGHRVGFGSLNARLGLAKPQQRLLTADDGLIRLYHRIYFYA